MIFIYDPTKYFARPNKTLGLAWLLDPMCLGLTTCPIQDYFDNHNNNNNNKIMIIPIIIITTIIIT
jgi:hypothetical protein